MAGSGIARPVGGRAPRADIRRPTRSAHGTGNASSGDERTGAQQDCAPGAEPHRPQAIGGVGIVWGTMPCAVQRNTETMKRVRAEWRRDGYCTRCGKAPAVVQGTRCQGCRAYDHGRSRKNRLDLTNTEAQTTH